MFGEPLKRYFLFTSTKAFHLIESRLLSKALTKLSQTLPLIQLLQVSKGSVLVHVLLTVSNHTEIHDKGSRGLIDLLSDLSEVFVETLTRPAVVIPVRVVELYEADTAFDQTSCQKAVVGKRSCTWFGAVAV